MGFESLPSPKGSMALAYFVELLYSTIELCSNAFRSLEYVHCDQVKRNRYRFNGTKHLYVKAGSSCRR